MRNEKRRLEVENLYRENENRMDNGLDEMVITQALDVATKEECCTKDDYFRELCALNLLNAAIKDKRYKGQLSYGFIKGRAASLLEQWLDNPVEGVNACYDRAGHVLLFDIDGVVLSYHFIPLTSKIRKFVYSPANRPIKWNGLRLQKIPVELFDLALAA